MSEVLNREEVINLRDGDTINGLVMIQSMELLPQKNGGKYIGGTLQAKGQIPFKVWSSAGELSPYVILSSNIEEKNLILEVKARVNRYGGIFSLILDSISLIKDCNYSVSDFLEDIYDSKAWFSKLMSVLKKNCSNKAVSLFEHIIEPVKDNFVSEFAAVKYHDSCKSGLLAHTTKVVRMASVLAMYPNILKRVDPDLIFLSCALHDIGKIYEYDNGSISKDGMKLSHHTFGVMLLMQNKDIIAEAMGKEFFNSLLSVVEQHHGEYGERPRTVIAYVVHRLDELESSFTILDELLKESDGHQIQHSGYKLV